MRNRTIKAFSVGIITGSFLTAGLIHLAVPAKAEPDSAVIAFAGVYGDLICDTLDTYPSFAGILGIGEAISENGLTAYQAGQVLYLAALNTCPRHLSLLQRFAASPDVA